MRAQAVLSVPPGVQIQVDEAPGPECGLSGRQRDKQFGAKIDRSLGSVLETLTSREREVPYSELRRLLPNRDPPSCRRPCASFRRRGW